MGAGGSKEAALPRKGRRKVRAWTPERARNTSSGRPDSLHDIARGIDCRAFWRGRALRPLLRSAQASIYSFRTVLTPRTRLRRGTSRYRATRSHQAFQLKNHSPWRRVATPAFALDAASVLMHGRLHSAARLRLTVGFPRGASIPRPVTLFGGVDISIDHLKVWQAPIIEQLRPRSVLAFVAHPKQRHAVVYLGVLP
jgi:hypothetical protein